MALITNSALIVNWTDINMYIQEPMHSCFITNGSIQNELSYEYRKEETYAFPYLTPNSFSSEKNLSQFWKYKPEEVNKTRLVFNLIGSDFYDLGCNTQFYPVFRDYGLVSEDTLDKAFAILNSTQIATTAESLNTAYRVGFELAHNILRVFWKPTPLITDQVDLIYEKHFRDNYIIGMQLRYEYLDCLDILAFVKCAYQIEAKVKTTKPFKWFISSDDSNNIEKIRRQYPEKVITASGKITHVNYDTSGFARALVDIELLAKTDELIITGSSSFGFDFLLLLNISFRFNYKTFFFY
jgi:hypothetical protein